MSGWLTGKRTRLIGAGEALQHAIVAAGGTITDGDDADLLIHAAAPAPQAPAQRMDHATWRDAIDTGLDQLFHAASAFAARCRADGRNGAILFIAAPEQGGGVAQAAASGALGNLTKTLGVEWARDGIRVNAVLTHGDNPALATLAAYLVSDYAAYITGMVTGIDDHD